jgi:nitroimidazol reductase NimA-like FMN-containing flavoprotein (pyridoxamine 5'-phosphate oxidase superfamily)
MLDIDEMGTKEIHDFLQQVQYGHLGCVFEGHPYVVPMHYYFENPDIYIFTTEGLKTKYTDANQKCAYKSKKYMIYYTGAALL